MDNCYAIDVAGIKSCPLDSDSEEEFQEMMMESGATIKVPLKNMDCIVEEGLPVLYDGDTIQLEKGDGAWLPVIIPTHQPALAATETKVVLGTDDSPVEVVPGIWDSDAGAGVLCVMGSDEFDTVLEPGTKIAEIHTAAVQTRICQYCDRRDTDAWPVTPLLPKLSLIHI